MKKIGTVTTGQSPRTDIVPNLGKIIGDEVIFIETGALDGLSRVEIDKLRPRDDEDVIVSRMRDGSEVTFGKSRILPRMQHCIDELNSKGVDLIAILCAGEFPEFKSKCLIIRPDKLMYGFLDSLRNLKKVGIMVPNERQITPFQRIFTDKGYDVVVTMFSPYRGDPPRESLLELIGEEISVVLMTCMGYTNKMKDKVKKTVNKPVITTQSLLAKAIQELTH